MKIFFLFLSLTLFTGPLLSQGGCRLLNYAKEDKLKEMSQLLAVDKRSRDNIDCFRGGEWISPLMAAVQNDNLDMVKLLLQYGANMNKSLSNKTAIDHCVSETMRSFLQETGTMGNRLVEAARKNDTTAVNDLLGSSMISVTSRGDKHYSAIAAAAEEGNADMIKKLLKLRSPVDHPQKGYTNDKTPLQFAAEKGHLDCVKILVEARANLDGNLRTGWTPLMLAIQNQHTDVAKYLVEKGAKLDLPIHNGAEPYSLAAARNEFDLLKFMLEKKNVIGSKKDLNHNIMAAACYSGNLEMFNYLIEMGISPAQISPYKGSNQLIRACNGGNLEMCKILVEKYRFDVNAQDEHKFTPLSTAVTWAKDVALIDYLLSKGADINGRAHAGYTPITRAIGNAEILEHLLKNGANPNPKNVIQSPLGTACALNKLESVKILIKYGANVMRAGACNKCHDADIKNHIEKIQKAQSSLFVDESSASKESIVNYIKMGGSPNSPFGSQGRTLLFHAAENNYVELAEDLIKLGANVHIKINKLSAIMAACHKKGHIEIIELLLKNGAKLERPEESFWDPLGNAVKRKDKKLIDYLINKGMTVNHRFKDSSTIMHVAAQTGDLEIFKYLEEKGGDPHVADKTNRTPFITACYHGDMAFMRYMVEELKVDVNTMSSNGASTAIKNVTWTNSLQKVKYLLDHGADPYITSENLEDAIQWSFQNAHIDSLHTFYTERGYKLKASIGNRRNVFDNMMKQKLHDRIFYAIRNGQVPDGFDTSYAVTLMNTALTKNDTAFCDTLLKYGADINGKLQNRNTLLWTIQENSYYPSQLTGYLLKRGADPNVLNGSHEQPTLMNCMRKSNYFALEQLLKAGANPNLTDKNGNHVWNHMSLIRGMPIYDKGKLADSRNTKALKLLKKYGADLRLKNEHDGRTAIFTACANADLSAVKYLHETIGLSVNDSTKYEVRPLFQSLNTFGYTTYSMEMPGHASLPFQKETFKYLLDQGADPNYYSTRLPIYGSHFNRGSRNHFVFYCAYNHPEAFYVLLDYIDPNMVAKSYAVSQEYSLVEFLSAMGLEKQLEKTLKKGGKVVNPKTGKSALDKAKNVQIKKLLEKYD